MTQEDKYISLDQISSFETSKVYVNDINLKQYISTENMVSNLGGITVATNKPEKGKITQFLEEDILISNIRPYLKKIWFANEKGGCSSDILVLRPNDKINSKYLYYLLSSDKFFNYMMTTSKGTKMPRGDKNAIKKFKIPLVPIIEQNTWVNLLSQIDKKLILMQKKHKNKVIFKNEFFNNYVSKLQNNDCNKFKLDKFITIHNKRNKNNDNIPVLSINNKLGFISQEEQFEDRNVASSDTKNYKIVEKGDFAYNPARINVGSIARLTNFDKGIISPMYIVFKTDSTIINSVFFENYIFTNYFKLEILKRLEGSVRLILSADSLKNIEISVPNLNEQQKIGEFLELLSKDIYLSEINLIKLKEFKKGLLQKMFV